MPAIILRIVHGLFLDAFDIPENIFFRDATVNSWMEDYDFCWARIERDFEWNSFERSFLFFFVYSFEEEIEQ